MGVFRGGLRVQPLNEPFTVKNLNCMKIGPSSVQALLKSQKHL